MIPALLLSALASPPLYPPLPSPPDLPKHPVPVEGKPWRVDKLLLPMVWIAPGSFTMGSPEGEVGRSNDEYPHAVTLTRGYWLGSTPVTTGQWIAEMGSNPSGDNTESLEAPVDTVSWNLAMEFCHRMTEEARSAGTLPTGYVYTLPTEAQWEYACRAGSAAARTGRPDAIAWYLYNSGNHKHAVARKQPNAWGLYDMEGNVNEWCLDWYTQYPRQGVSVDPIGPEFGTEKVFRGGAFRDFPEKIRCAERYGHQPWECGRGTGLRLALAPEAGYRHTPGTVYRYVPLGTPPIAGIPDPLRDPAGQPIATADAWRRRREQMREIMADAALGHVPPPPGNLISEVVRTEPVLNGEANYRLVRLRFGPGHACQFLVAVYVPARATGPVPFWVFLGFRNTPGAPASAWTPASQPLVTAERFARERIDALRRGYGVLTFDYQEAGIDNSLHGENRQTGFFPQYPQYDWSAIAAWAWAASRCVDYLQTQPFCDATKIAVTGHSRLGKVTLTAAAYDDRFALAVPTGSGSGGTGLYRENSRSLNCQNSLEDGAYHNPSWFSPHLAKWFGRVNDLPFDQHWLIALAAPRPLLSSEAYDDMEATPRASVYSVEAAMPVYRWLHASDRLGMYFRPGGHDNVGVSTEGGGLNDVTWQASLDFADHWLRGLPARQDFSQVPDPSQLK